jgi:hypothetical protein
MPVVTYNGKVPSIELVNYGHFSPGDSKTVDDLTAAGMDNELCKAEGWSVDYGDEKRSRKSADIESTKPAAESHRRSHRTEE